MAGNLRSDAFVTQKGDEMGPTRGVVKTAAADEEGVVRVESRTRLQFFICCCMPQPPHVCVYAVTHHVVRSGVVELKVSQRK